jgi:acyl transferase domain-containing protein
MVVDTACSSSLVALHLAVQQIRSGASTLAVAAGTNLILDPFFYISMSNLSMLSPTGKSQMWDAQANGYARGEGVAAVVLKPLHKALQDGDHIECLIRETGINQDGRTQGITTPNGVMQAQLIRDTYHRAGLKPTPENCQFFEAHGTGTQAGDPQEAQAICNAFFDGNVQSSDRKLWVGSAKTVVGHAEGCAGLAGLLKASAALQNSTIPPNLLFHTPNPKLEEYMKHLQVPTTTKAWPPVLDGEPRRASVNSFGTKGLCPM